MVNSLLGGGSKYYIPPPKKRKRDQGRRDSGQIIPETDSWGWETSENIFFKYCKMLHYVAMLQDVSKMLQTSQKAMDSPILKRTHLATSKLNQRPPVQTFEKPKYYKIHSMQYCTAVQWLVTLCGCRVELIQCIPTWRKGTIHYGCNKVRCRSEPLLTQWRAAHLSKKSFTDNFAHICAVRFHAPLT